MDESDGRDKKEKSRRGRQKEEVWCYSVIFCFTETAGEARGREVTHTHTVSGLHSAKACYPTSSCHCNEERTGIITREETS